MHAHEHVGAGEPGVAVGGGKASLAFLTLDQNTFWVSFFPASLLVDEIVWHADTAS